MNFTVDEYESVGEHAAYQNAVLANKAKRDRISSPRVTTIIPSSPIPIATPPPVSVSAATQAEPSQSQARMGQAIQLAEPSRAFDTNFTEPAEPNQSKCWLSPA